MLNVVFHSSLSRILTRWLAFLGSNLVKILAPSSSSKAVDICGRGYLFLMVMSVRPWWSMQGWRGHHRVLALSHFTQVVSQRTELLILLDELLFLRPESLNNQNTKSIFGQFILSRPEPERGPNCRIQRKIKVQKWSLIQSRIRYTEVRQESGNSIQNVMEKARSKNLTRSNN